MALLGFEGFDNIAAGGINTNLTYMPFMAGGTVTGRWTVGGVGAIAKVAGLLSGFGIRSGPGLSAFPTINFFNNYKTVTLGFRYFTSAVFQDAPMVEFQDLGVDQVGLSVSATGKLYLWRGTESNVLATGTTTLTPASWYQMDVTVTIDNTAGSIELNLAGVPEIPLTTGLDTQSTANAYINDIRFLLIGNEFNAFDDLYVNDDTGPSPLNGPLGLVRVETLYPVANSSVAWTPLTSTNWVEVSEASMDSDASYNFNSTTGIDEFTHGPLDSIPANIFAADVISAARKNDVSAIPYRNKLVSGVTTADGVTNPLATTYIYVRDDYQNDPNTGVPWTKDGINNSIIGYEKF